jgi:hypothetical protein
MARKGPIPAITADAGDHRLVTALRRDEQRQATGPLSPRGIGTCWLIRRRKTDSFREGMRSESNKNNASVNAAAA